MARYFQKRKIATKANSRGDGLAMLQSRAQTTAARMTVVEAKQSCAPLGIPRATPQLIRHNGR